MKQKVVSCYLFAVLVTLDQITKLIFSNRDFFVGWLHVHAIQNYGLSFSLNFGVTINLILIVIGLVFLFYYYWSRRTVVSKYQQWAFVFIFGGAVSNVADRIYFGFVRDFLDIGLGFTFNLADIFIMLGLIVLLFHKDGDKFGNKQIPNYK